MEEAVVLVEGNSDDVNERPASFIARACDNCRTRKVRCDKESPCSGCRSLKIACRTTHKIIDPRKRVLVSNHLEKKIESIDERLSRIERGLEALLSGSTAKGPEHVGRHRELKESRTKGPLSLVSPPAESVPVELDGEAAFEGDSSLTAHSIQARMLFEETLKYSIRVGRSKELDDALLALKNTLKAQSAPSAYHTFRFSEHAQIPQRDESGVEMPPLNAVLSLLRTIKNVIPRSFLECPFLTVAELIEMCQSVYFCTEDYSPARYALVNGCLFYLFQESEISKASGGDVATNYEQYAHLCRLNLERTLETFHIFIAPTLENCQALLIGSVYASDASKPPLCHRLLSTVAQMCLSLGYHRLKEDSPEVETKKAVFWYVYVLDKALSLRLGRTSILQDCDISTNMPALCADPMIRPWYLLWAESIKFARFQGQIFDQLYTYRALNASTEERSSKARRLASGLDELQLKRVTILSCTTFYQDSFEAFSQSIELAHYAMLTLLYRAIPPIAGSASPIFTDECIISARMALESHQAMARRFKDKDSQEAWQGYINWALLYSPFSPFMVLFCHIVTTRNTPDLEYLSDFLDSMQSSECCMTNDTDRLHRLFSVFYHLAKVYLKELPTKAVLPNQSVDPNLHHSVAQIAQGDVPQLVYSAEEGLTNSRQTLWSAANSLPPVVPFEVDDYMLNTIEDWFVGDQFVLDSMNADFGVLPQN